MLTRLEIELVHNSLNEVLHGLRESQRVKTVLAHRDKLAGLMRKWSDNPTEQLLLKNLGLISMCVRVVIEELGEGEFETRVGVPINKAETFVQGRCKGNNN
jgi:hypothetical protein